MLTVFIYALFDRKQLLCRASSPTSTTLLSSTTTSTSLTPQCLVAATISLWEPTATFFGKLSSPLLCFANDEIVQL